MLDTGGTNWIAAGATLYPGKQVWMMDTSFIYDLKSVELSGLAFATLTSRDQLCVPLLVVSECDSTAKQCPLLSQTDIVHSTQIDAELTTDSTYPEKLSEIDRYGIGLAASLGWGLYTSDRLQAEEAGRRGVPVRSTWWVLSKALNMDLLSEPFVREIYQKMRRLRRRLPNLVYFFDYHYFGWPCPVKVRSRYD